MLLTRFGNIPQIGTYHGKEEHGMLVLDALNKTPSLNMIQKPMDKMIASMQNDKLSKQFETQWNNMTWQKTNL